MYTYILLINLYIYIFIDYTLTIYLQLNACLLRRKVLMHSMGFAHNGSVLGDAAELDSNFMALVQRLEAGD